MITVLLAEAEGAVAYMTLQREDLESGDWVLRHAEDVRYMAPLCSLAAVEYGNIVIEWDGSRGRAVRLLALPPPAGNAVGCCLAW